MFKNWGPNSTYGYKIGSIMGLIGGIGLAVVPGWIAFAIATGAAAVVPIPNRPRTFWQVVLSVAAMGIVGGAIGELVARLFPHLTS